MTLLDVVVLIKEMLFARQACIKYRQRKSTYLLVNYIYTLLAWNILTIWRGGWVHEIYACVTLTITVRDSLVYRRSH